MNPPLHILLVDDEVIVRETLTDYLRDCGHLVTEAGDGRQAAALMEQSGYDAVLADVRMPGLDGLALLERRRQLSDPTPFVMMTGHGDAETDGQAERLGANGFLIKPIRLLELDDTIRRLCGEGQTR